MMGVQATPAQLYYDVDLEGTYARATNPSGGPGVGIIGLFVGVRPAQAKAGQRQRRILWCL